MCNERIQQVTAHACNGTVCTNMLGHMISTQSNMLGHMISTQSGMTRKRVRATFTDLEEDTKYSVYLSIHYNGGLVQRTDLVQISECVMISCFMLVKINILLLLFKAPLMYRI